MLPTGGRRYDHAVILVITFSVSDLPSVAPLRNELLHVLKKNYKWSVEQKTIDSSLKHDVFYFGIFRLL